MNIIRLACRFCDRNDFDGVESLPADWFDIDEVQTYEDSTREVDLADQSESVLDWFTHLGVCPECQRAELWPTEKSA